MRHRHNAVSVGSDGNRDDEIGSCDSATKTFSTVTTTARTQKTKCDDDNNENDNNNGIQKNSGNKKNRRVNVITNPIRGIQRQRINDIHTHNKLKREKEKEERCICYLMTATVFLSILVAGGLVYLIFMSIDDGDLSYYLQPYINKNTTTTNTTMSSNDMFLKAVFATDTETDDDKEEFLPSTSSSSIYEIPNSMPHIGDKSDIYARLRQDWDERYPPNPERSLLVVRKAQRESIYDRLIAPPPSVLPSSSSSSSSKVQNDNDNDNDNNYDIYNCPDYPPPIYPREYKTIDILQHWPPTQSLPVGGHDDENDESESESENATIMAHLGICVFDYSNDYMKILQYRSKEVPFVVRNDPSVAETVERWNDENYRRKLFGGLDHTGSDSDSDSDSDGTNDENNNDNDSDNNNNRKTIYHRAERSVTNQILFRQQKKRRPPHVNTYNTINYQKKKEKTTKYDNIHEQLSPPPPLPPPTKLISMTYEKWYNLAKKKENKVNISSIDGIQYYDTNQIRDKSSFYYYFRLVGCGEKKDCETNSTEYLFDELPFFQPRRSNEMSGDKQQRRRRTKQRRGRRGQRQQEREEPANNDQLQEEEVQSLYLVDPDQQRGIHCRFGMPGMIAANHYDASRNTIAILGGARRYILSRPQQCSNMGLFPIKHPSARHSKVDWTTASADYYHDRNDDNDNDDDVEEKENDASTASPSDPSWKAYNESLSLLANNATSTEVVLEAGDVLYLPSYWFHFIISLNVNMQCNTRSGRNDKDNQVMKDCGFPHPPAK